MITAFLNKIPLFEEKIKKAKKILLLSHANPDGDNVGSMLAFNNILTKLGKEITMYTTPQVPDFLKWLPDAKKIIEINKTNSDLVNENSFNHFDLIIGVDFNSSYRLKIFANAYINSPASKILIDHHPNPENCADIIFSEEKYAACAEFIYDIFSHSSFFPLFDKTTATCIYTGIMTDTGSFAFNSSNPNTFRVVAKLLECQIDKDEIYSNTYETFSLDRLRFKGFVISQRLIVIKKLKTAYIYISAEDRIKFKEKFGDTENFVNIPLSLKGIYFSAIFIERDNFVKASFRSKGNFSVNDFSQKHFNGGGHTNASGGESKDSLENTRFYFEKLINEDYYDILSTYEI